MANEVISGAGQGASTGASIGAVAGPVGAGWGAVIGGAIGAIGGFLSSGSSRKAERERKHLMRKAKKALKPEAILANAAKFTPKMRELVAQGIGPGIEQRVASNLARSGFEGTGAGEALRGLSFQSPGFVASQGALSLAQQTAVNYANSLMGSAQMVNPQPNQALAAVAGGLQGALGTYLAMRPQPQQPTQQTISITPDVRPPGTPPHLPPPVPDFIKAPSAPVVGAGRPPASPSWPYTPPMPLF